MQEVPLQALGIGGIGPGGREGAWRGLMHLRERWLPVHGVLADAQARILSDDVQVQQPDRVGAAGRACCLHGDDGAAQGRWGFLDDGMGVGPTEAEAGDGDPQGRALRLQGGGLTGQFEAAVGEVVVGTHVDVRGHHAVLEHQQSLGKRGRTRRSERVPHQRFDRAQRELASWAQVRLEEAGERGDLRVIAHGCARAVRLHVLDAGGVNIAVGALVGADLSLVAWCEDGALCAIGGNAQAAHQAQRPAPGVQGFAQGLDQERGHAFARHDAVRVLCEGFQAGVGRQGLQLRKAQEELRRQEHVDASHDGAASLAGVDQRLRCGQRIREGAAGRVDAQPGAVDRQGLGDVRQLIGRVQPVRGEAAVHRQVAVCAAVTVVRPGRAHDQRCALPRSWRCPLQGRALPQRFADPDGEVALLAPGEITVS